MTGFGLSYGHCRNARLLPDWDMRIGTENPGCRRLNAFLGYGRLSTSDRPLESYPTEKTILPILGWRCCYTGS